MFIQFHKLTHVSNIKMQNNCIQWETGSRFVPSLVKSSYFNPSIKRHCEYSNETNEVALLI